MMDLRLPEDCAIEEEYPRYQDQDVVGIDSTERPDSNKKSKDQKA